MTWLISKIVGNPVVLIVLLVGAFAVGATSGGSAAWWIQGLRVTAAQNATAKVQGQFDQYVVEATKAAQAEQAKQLAKEAGWLQNKDAADRVAKEKEDALKSEIVALTAGAGSLRNTIAKLHEQLRKSSVETILRTSDALGAALDECQERYRSVAEDADRCRIAVEAIERSWPE